MGTFVGHLVPGLALAILGLWHVVNTIRTYCFRRSNCNFATRFWYPFPKIKHLELISIFSFSLFSIFALFIEFPSLKLTFELDALEHATIFIHLAIYSGFTLLAALNDFSEIFSGVLAASLFSQELFLLHFHSTDHVGLEGHYHWLLQVIVLVSLIFTLLAVTCPASFPIGLILAISVSFQGVWFINMGFVLWLPQYVPQGCFAAREDHDNNESVVRSAVACPSLEADARARALANLQFSWILSGLLVFTSCVYLVFCRKKIASNCDSAKYERLHGKGGDVHVIVDEFSKENS